VNVFEMVDTIAIGHHRPSSGDHDASSQPPIIHLDIPTPLAKARMPYSFCPASARLVHTYNSGDLAISDFL